MLELNSQNVSTGVLSVLILRVKSSFKTCFTLLVYLPVSGGFDFCESLKTKSGE